MNVVLLFCSNIISPTWLFNEDINRFCVIDDVKNVKLEIKIIEISDVSPSISPKYNFVVGDNDVFIVFNSASVIE